MTAPALRSLAALLPSREEFAVLYRYLRANGGYEYKTETLVHQLGNRIPYGKLRVMLEAMSELGLIMIQEGLKQNRITLNPVEGKVDLESARIIRAIREAIQ